MQLRNITLIIFILYIFSSCYEPSEGCMDVYASNFDVSADQNCCCEYPQLRILNDFVVDTIDYNVNTIMYDADKTAFLVRDVAIGMHNIEITGERDYTLLDTINAFRKPIVFSKILMISTRNIVQNFKKIRKQIVFNAQAIQPGFPEEIDEIPSDSIPGDYILNNFRYLYDSTDMEWRNGSVTIVPDTAVIDSTIRLFLGDMDFTIEGNISGKNDIGGNADVILQIDLEKLFSEFRLGSSRSEQEANVTNSLPGALLFTND